MAALKRIEFEVTREVEAITGAPEFSIEQVDPSQFYGIELKPWAREIAELTLWIGYHQWWRQTHGHAQPPEPILRDTGTLDCRDAVLSWMEIREDPARARPDPTPRIKSPVTGELIPDPERQLRYLEHLGATPATWPEADFIVGNPPYMGRGRQRDAFGDGYVDALRAAYPEVPDNADYVMYWWYRAAKETAAGRVTRAGLITTNTIRQQHNRQIVAEAAAAGAQILWSVPDHPWVDETGSAAVRVSMTVIGRGTTEAMLVQVDDEAKVLSERRVPRLNADLTAHADVPRAAAEPLLANEGISSQGFILVGAGFVLEAEEGRRLHSTGDGEGIVKRYLTGRDLTKRPREQYVIDFGLRGLGQVKEHPVAYDIVRDRVKPTRDANARRSYRDYWWRFGEPRSSFRPALDGLPRFIATVETSKHRFFVFLEADTTPSHTIICIALDDFYHLGVLSSALHVAWALAAGGRLGVGNDPRYQKAKCFDAFPFPEPSTEARQRVSAIMDRIHRHREKGLARGEEVTMTYLYNVVEKLRAEAVLTPNERRVHELGACGSLKDLHDELDAEVAACYEWPWPMEEGDILDHLVRLHDDRRAEEANGRIRWLRAEHQIPRFAPEKTVEQLAALEEEPKRLKAPTDHSPWPDAAVDQLGAVKAAVERKPGTVEEISAQFRNARRAIVERHLETLHILAEVQKMDDGRYHAPGASRTAELPG
jgi:hypothetical protein